MSEYIPKYPSKEGDDSNKTSSELLAETLKPIYVPQDLMLAWESHLASYSRDTNVLLDQVKDSELALNTQYQALLARVQKYEQMLQDITMDSNEFTVDDDEVNFTGWNILAQASYWDYLLRKEITKLSDQIKSAEYKGGLVTEVTDAVLEGLIADNTYISNVIGALSDTPLIRELDEALTSTTTSLAELQAEYVRLMQKQAADAEALANQQVENAEQLIEAINASIAEQLDRIAQEAAIRTQLLQELEDRVNDASAQAEADVAELNAQVDSIREGAAADKASILETVSGYRTELKSDIATVNTELLEALDGVNTLVTEVRDENVVTLNELTTYKASNDVAVAGLVSKVSTNVSETAANASKISGLTADLATTNAELGTVRNTSANALSKADTAVTANSALATRVDALSAAITDLGEGAETTVDVYAFNALKAEVETNAAGVSSLVEQVDALGTNYTNLADGVEANTDAVSTLTVKQSEMNGDISQLSSDVTFLTSELGVTNTALDTKASNQALSNLNTKLETTDGKVAANTQQLTQLNSDLTTVKNGLETKASTEALNNLATEVIELEDGLAVNASAITNLKAEMTTELNKKATVTAVNGLTTKVEEVEGKTTTNANSIIALNTSVGNVVNGLATKLDASTISDYYTKGQTDAKAAEIAAGKVEEFNANLKIGGRNLWNPSETISAYESGGSYTHSNDAHRFLPTYLEVSGSKLLLQIWNPNKVINKSNTNRVAFYTEDKTYISSIGLNHLSGETYQKQEFNIPANAKYMRLGVISGLSTYDNSIKFKFELGTVYTEWTASEEEVANSISSNSTAIQNTNAEVSRVDGRVTATNSAQTLLEGRVQTVEGGISKKADASALSSLDTRVGSVEGKYTSQASDITRLNNSLDTTNLNVGTAQTAAQDAMNAAGAKGKVIFGSDQPGVADRLSQNLWIDTTGGSNTPKRWNGAAWTIVTDKVASDAANAVSALDTVVRTKADVSALNSLTTKVDDEAGKTTANTNSITTLNSDIVKINNDLATKANASALSDMYTKTQADDKATEIAAGKVESYDAKLVIGGTNLLLNSDFSEDVSWTKWGDNGGGYTKVSDPTYGSVVQTNLPDGLVHNWVKLENNVEYTYSALVKPSNDLYMNGSSPLHYWAGKDDNSQHKIQILSASHTLIEAGKWSRISMVFKLTDDANTFRPFIFGLSGVLQIAWTKLERGNKATDWSPNTDEVQQSIDANASAIESTNAEVSRVDGRVTTEANRTTSLAGRVSTVENGLSLKADVTALNNIYTKSETDAKATSLAAGEISKYDASLVIGGTNLLNSSMVLSNTSDTYRGGKIYRQTRTASQTDIQDFGISMSDLDAGDYTLSFDIKSSINVPSNASNLSYFYGPNNTTKLVTSQGYTNNYPDGRTEKQVTTSWQRIWITWTQSSATESKGLIINRIYGNGLDYTVDIANIKFEKGNKATAWTPADSDIQNALNANAGAISQTNAAVNAIEGVVTSHSNSITSLSNEILNLNIDTANISNAVSILDSKIDSSNDSITNQASSIVKLDAAIKANTASDNLIPNPTFDSAYDQMGYTVVPSINSEVPSNCPYRFVAKLNSRDNVPTIEDIACTAGDVYEISVYVACAQGTHNFNLMVFEKDFKDGNRLGYPSGGGLAPTSVWTKRVWRWTVRDGVTFFKPMLQIDTFDNSTVWYATNWKVTNVSAAAKAQTTADAAANTLAVTNATVSQLGDVIIANTESIQSAESRIAANESSIQGIQNTYATRDSVGSLAQTALESVWQDDITKAVGDISVGGVNLLSNTAYLSASSPPQVLGGSGYFLSGLNPNYHAGTSSTGENHFVIDNVYAERYIRIQAAVSNTSTLKPNSTYTFSVKIRGAAKPLSFRIIVLRNGGWTDIVKENIEYGDDIFSTHGCTFTIPLETTGIIISLQSYSANLGESFAIQNSSMKLEEGNVVTAWTPSTSEVQAQIDASAAAISTLDTKVLAVDGRVTTQASSIATLQADVGDHSSKLIVQGDVVDGLKASYVVKTDVNGLVAGYGLYNTGSSSAFGVNADYFYVGSNVNGKKPFLVLTSSQTIDGITYPAGTWIDTAIIANATIGSAHIADASITNAKIGDASIDNAKIANLSAEKITAGTIDAARIGAGSITADKIQVASLSAVSANLGSIKVGSANIEALSVDAIHIKDRAVTVPIASQQTLSGATFSGSVAANWTKSIYAAFPGVETVSSTNFCTLFFRSDVRFYSTANKAPLVMEIYLADVRIGSVASRVVVDGSVTKRVWVVTGVSGEYITMVTGVTEGAYIDEQGAIQVAFNMPYGINANSAIEIRLINKGGTRNVVVSGSYVNLYLVEFKK